jgi:hypothetical protein
MSTAPVAGTVLFNLPHGVTVRGREGGFEDALSTFLSTGKRGASKRFTLDRVHVASNAASVSNDSNEQLANLSAILKAFPQIELRVAAPSAKMADAVKTALVGHGVEATRITMPPQSDPASGAGLDVIVTKR